MVFEAPFVSSRKAADDITVGPVSWWVQFQTGSCLLGADGCNSGEAIAVVDDVVDRVDIASELFGIQCANLSVGVTLEPRRR